MAITKIHNIKSTLSKALAYIENPDKTDEQILVSGYNCDPLSASLEFEMTAQLAKDVLGDTTAKGGNNNLAQHMMQSFAPWDKITPEQAHEIGKKLADEFLGGKYEYVITTHVDKKHIHNHIIFNSTSFYNFKKFDNYKVAGKIRTISDRLCEEHGLYVTPRKQKGKAYHEWQQRKSGLSWKAQFETSIDQIIKQSGSYDDFLKGLQQAKIEVKEGAHIAFRMEGQTRFCRGKTLGENYTKEQIIQRIDANEKAKEETLYQRVERRSRRAALAETKALSSALLTLRNEKIQSTKDVHHILDTVAAETNLLKDQLKTLDTKNAEYKKVAGYLQTVQQYAAIVEQLEQSRFSRKSLESKYQHELSAYRYAVSQLEARGLNANLDYDKIIGLIQNQTERAGALQKKIHENEKRASELKHAFEIVQAVDRGDSMPTPSRNKDKSNR